MAKSASGETSKEAQTRALLFDMTFLILIRVIQLYGLEVCQNPTQTVQNRFFHEALSALGLTSRKHKNLLFKRNPQVYTAVK